MDITMHDIPAVFHAMADEIGMDNFIKIIRLYGGESVYFPLLRTLSIPSRNKKIKEEYNGTNASILIHKYNLSYNYIIKILKS